MDNVLKIQNLSKKIKDSFLVNDINFELKEGDIFGFLGPNGAGKSTTIKMILGLVKPSSGNVWINNFSVLEDKDKALMNIGAMVESPSFYEYMSGYDNLKLYANLYKLSNNKIDEVLELVNLTNDKDKKVKNYSLGMKQRLGIARAFLNDPKLVILDEPTNGLDPVGIIEIRNLIKKLAKDSSVTFLICSHILSEMQSVCNKVAIINRGKILVDGDVTDLLQKSGFNKLEDYYMSVLEGVANA
ncbi:MAG: ABC transporter ATP-binding protein [Acutalibacteraceae bacterium]|nr:ABC transporter ATP-binding protein [Acutalibacteraceae bacterium]